MSDEKRKDRRHSREEKIFIEVLAASSDTASDNLMLECSTRDISKNGLKIHARFPFIQGSILELLLNFESGGYKFLLTGEVKWVENISDEDYLAGFELVDAEHSDYMVWQKMFAEAS
ncbi:PilZ domain-containing protein [Aliikangiella sp. G2MR2-5]|uniref:PilZ domain-containing protein n=1 Tax=Aliikangiella sp. G2MR2-5 TaxID=2788943 RepID=UPI0018A8F140|nr:PilZ domain-containing protein [Aliikangiella sp. G2MR2-5]